MAPKDCPPPIAGNGLRTTIAVRRAGLKYGQILGFSEADLVEQYGLPWRGIRPHNLPHAHVHNWTAYGAIRNSAPQVNPGRWRPRACRSGCVGLPRIIAESLSTVPSSAGQLPGTFNSPAPSPTR
jgi:hypothetical protein